MVSQLVRSPGVYFTADEDPATGRELCIAKLIPNRGAWLEFETSNKDVLSVKVDRKRKIPVTTLLRADRLSTTDDGDRTGALRRASTPSADHHYIAVHAREGPHQAPATRRCIEFYKQLRPGDPPTRENAATAAQLAVLQPPPLRPRPGRPLQAEQAPAASGDGIVPSTTAC